MVHGQRTCRPAVDCCARPTGWVVVGASSHFLFECGCELCHHTDALLEGIECSWTFLFSSVAATNTTRHKNIPNVMIYSTICQTIYHGHIRLHNSIKIGTVFLLCLRTHCSLDNSLSSVPTCAPQFAAVQRNRSRPLASETGNLVFALAFSLALILSFSCFVVSAVAFRI